jgi:hypothetical protein
MQTGVAVEKVHFSRNSRNFGDRQFPAKPGKPFVGIPNAKFCRPFSGEGVFQQPQAMFSPLEKIRKSGAPIALGWPTIRPESRLPFTISRVLRA